MHEELTEMGYESNFNHVLSPVPNLTWLPSLLDALPQVPPLPKTLFDIAGFPRSENVNSNCLAFYLDEREEHGFGRLFLDSLMALASKDGNWHTDQRFEAVGGYKVLREDTTDNSKRIDLHLRTPKDPDAPDEGWTIVIENKIDAWLYNDLGSYAKHIDTRRSLRIVLSPYTLKTDAEKAKMKAHGFIHLTHRAWMAEIKAALPDYTTIDNARHLHLLQEFLRSIERIYQAPMTEARNEAIRHQFRDNQKEVRELLKADEQLSGHILDSAIRAMKQLGYEPDTRMAASGKHFRRAGESNKTENGALRLYLWLDGLRFTDELHCYYELHGAAIKHGAAVRTQLRALYPDMPNKHTAPVSFATDSKTKGSHIYFHLFFLKLKIEPGEASLATRIRGAFEKHFFEPGYPTAAFEAYQAAKLAPRP